MFKKCITFFSLFICSICIHLPTNITTDATKNVTFTNNTLPATIAPVFVEQFLTIENTSEMSNKTKNENNADEFPEVKSATEDTSEMVTETNNKKNNNEFPEVKFTSEVENTTEINLETTKNETAQLNLNEINETDCSRNAVNRENRMPTYSNEVISNVDRCPMFKNGVEVPLTDLTGDWSTVCYKAKSVISCFKIKIRKTSLEEKLNNREKYGSLNSSVDWHKCHLEITGSRIQGRHYLQGGLGDEGVFRNIIVVRNERCTVLQEEAPDQWRAFNGLLILRACDNGDVIVFTRFGKRPTEDEIKDAMEDFGETKFEGKLTCYVDVNRNDTEKEGCKGDIPTPNLEDSPEQSGNTIPVYDASF